MKFDLYFPSTENINKNKSNLNIREKAKNPTRN